MAKMGVLIQCTLSENALCMKSYYYGALEEQLGLSDLSNHLCLLTRIHCYKAMAKMRKRAKTEEGIKDRRKLARHIGLIL
jgi:hypothetical protein